MCCIHTMEYDSALKRKVILTQATTWMNPDNIMLSEISPQRQKLDDSTAMRPYGCQIHRDRRQNVGVRVWEEADGEFVLNGDRVSVLQDENYSEMDGGDASNRNILNATELHVHLKRFETVNVSLHIFYHSKTKSSKTWTS